MNKYKKFFYKKERLLFCGTALIALGLTVTNSSSVKAASEKAPSGKIVKDTSANSHTPDKTPVNNEKAITADWNGIQVYFDKASKTLTIPNGEIDLQKDKSFASINSLVDGKKIDRIEHISFTGKVKIVGSAAYMFANLDKLVDITGLNNLDTTEVTDMSFMFEGCTKLTSVDLSKFETSKVTDMNAMFYDCSSLTDLNVSTFNTLNVTSMMSMFNSCTNLKTITGLNKFNVKDVDFLTYMFNADENLISLDLSGFKMEQGKAYFEKNMLQGLTSLTSITLNKETTINNAGFTTPVIWQNVGKGSLEKPEGTEKIASRDLSAKYDGYHSGLPENETYVFFEQANSTAASDTPITPSTPAPIIPSHDGEKKPSDNNKNKKPINRVIIHTSYLYDKNGISVREKYTAGSNIQTYGSMYIKGKKFYSLGDGKFVKASNITGIKRKLIHNAYEYNSKGKRASRKVLKKNKTVKTYGGAIKIHGKKFYMISQNRFVKQANF